MIPKPSERELSEECRSEKCNVLDENIVRRPVKLSEDGSSSAEENHTCPDSPSISERCRLQTSTKSLDKDGAYNALKLTFVNEPCCTRP